MLAASTNLTGFEKPWLPSKKLAKLSYIGNINTYGDIPEFLGGLNQPQRPAPGGQLLQW